MLIVVICSDVAEFNIVRMHASNLLKAVLKPRSISSNSSGQKLNAKDARGPQSSSPDSGLSLSVTKKASPAPKPAVKMSCLCAPTNHAGSFRCRLHRSTQRSWGGRPVPAVDTTSNAPTAATSGKGPSPTPSVDGESANSKRGVQQVPRQPTAMAFAPAHRSSDSMPRPSRLSRVSAASDVDSPVAEASTPAPSSAPKV